MISTIKIGIKINRPMKFSYMHNVFFKNHQVNRAFLLDIEKQINQIHLTSNSFRIMEEEEKGYLNTGKKLTRMMCKRHCISENQTRCNDCRLK